MEIKVYKYFVILIILSLIIISYLFYPFIVTFEKNIQTIFILVISLMELNLLSIYWTLSNYEKNKDKIGPKGEPGDKGLPGTGGDPEICTMCQKPESSKSPETTKPNIDVLLELKILSENSEKKIEDKAKKLKNYTMLNKNITLSTSRKFDALLGKFGKPTNKKITNIIVSEPIDNSNVCRESIETSGDVKICIERNENAPGITKEDIHIKSTKPNNQPDLLPLTYNLSTNTQLYLYIEK